MHPEVPTQRQQALPVRAHEVRHGLPAHAVTMKPNAAVEGEAHPLAAALELATWRRYEQVILPSTVALPTGAAVPEIR
jgi:hypothetical protein